MAKLDALLGGLGGLRRNLRSESGSGGEVRITEHGAAGLPACGYVGRSLVLRAACALRLGLAAL
jgi:hypothetical protein